MTTHRHRLLALSLTVAVAMAACGSSDDDSTAIATASQTAPPATPEPTPTPSAPADTMTPTTPPSAAATTDAPSDDPAAAAPASTTIAISDFTFAAPTSVAPGAEVTVDNADGVLHTVSADDDSFDIQVPASSTGSFTAPSEPGDHAFVCNLHANMSATLTVG